MSEVTTGAALSSGDHHQQQQYQHQSVMHHPTSHTNLFNSIPGAPFLPPGLLLPSSEEEEEEYDDEEEHIIAGSSKVNTNNCSSGSHGLIHNEEAMNRDDGISKYFKMDFSQSINMPSSSSSSSLICNPSMGSDRFSQSRLSQLRDERNDSNGFMHSYPHPIVKMSDGRGGEVGSQYCAIDNSGIGCPPSLCLGDSKGERKTINDDKTWAFNGFHDVFTSYNSTNPLNQSSSSSSSSSTSNSSSRPEYLYNKQQPPVVKPSSSDSSRNGGLLVVPALSQSSQPCYNYKSSTSLNEWLPHVLVGFPQEWIQSSCDKLIDEGFIVVNDLIIAKQLQQLTYEYLQHTIGFKMGHCNRLMMELDKVKEGGR